MFTQKHLCAEYDLLEMVGAAGILVWLICDITELLTTLDPTHEKKSKRTKRRRRRKHVETG